MRSYKNLVLELLEIFTKFTIYVIPRDQNTIADALATSTSVFKIPIYPNRNYKIQVKHRPAILDNVKYWQVFEDNQQIKRFLENDEEFINTQIDDENQFGKNNHMVDEVLFSAAEKDDYLNVLGGKEII